MGQQHLALGADENGTLTGKFHVSEQRANPFRREPVAIATGNRDGFSAVAGVPEKT
jgi:hypothetical protein